MTILDKNKHVWQAWNLIVAYLIPTWLYRLGCYLRWPRTIWAKSSCDDCPVCQKIEAERPGSI